MTRPPRSALTLVELPPPAPPTLDAAPPPLDAPGPAFRWFEAVVRDRDGVEGAWACCGRDAGEAARDLLERCLSAGQTQTGPLPTDCRPAAPLALVAVRDLGEVARCHRHAAEQVLWTVPGGPGASQPAPFRVHACRRCVADHPRRDAATPLHPAAPPLLLDDRSPTIDA